LRRLSIAVAIHCTRHHAIGKSDVEDLGIVLPDKRILNQLSHLGNEILIREISVQVAVGVDKRKPCSTQLWASASHKQIILHDTNDALILASRNHQP
jgi:hypothetical protein